MPYKEPTYSVRGLQAALLAPQPSALEDAKDTEMEEEIAVDFEADDAEETPAEVRFFSTLARACRILYQYKSVQTYDLVTIGLHERARHYYRVRSNTVGDRLAQATAIHFQTLGRRKENAAICSKGVCCDVLPAEFRLCSDLQQFQQVNQAETLCRKQKRESAS